MPASQAGRRGFDPRPPLHFFKKLNRSIKFAARRLGDCPLLWQLSVARCAALFELGLMSPGHEADGDRQNKVKHEGYKPSIQSHEGISPAEDEERNRNDSNNQPGENSGPAGAAPVQPQNNSGKELRDSGVPKQQ